MPSSLKALGLLAGLITVGGVGWWCYANPGFGDVPRGGLGANSGSSEALSDQLAQVRLSCEVSDLDTFIEEHRQRVKAKPTAENLRVLAEALYERMLARDQERGFKVGGFIAPESYEANKADIEAGLEALAKARAAGDDSAESYRLEAGFLAAQLTDLGTVLAKQTRISQALRTALEKDPKNGHAHVAAGCRLLFVPGWLGQDIEKSLEHFQFAAAALPLNERPHLFVAFACFLQDKRQKCLEWLRKARDRNPKNPFVRAVLARLLKGEAKPFERDVE